MKRYSLLLWFLVILVLFAFISQSIISIKLQELRFGILRDQLMNYELSSQTLKERLKQMFLTKDDYITEVRVNILESGIMNAETEGLKLELSFFDVIGLHVINAVRFLNLKPKLELLEHQSTILQLQFSFYMERTRKYSIASEKYQILQDSISNPLSDEMAFALLHQGYCLVMMGEKDKAFLKLRQVTDLFSGTHYAENASLLLDFLEESNRMKTDLKSTEKSPEKLALVYFQTGDYEETIKSLDSLPNLNKDQSYMKARAMEELGKTSNAVEEYIKLVKQKENKEVAVRANRRLLLIGNFYQENSSLASFAKTQAEELGDRKAVENVEVGKSLVLKPIIVEKLQEAKTVPNETNSEIRSLQLSLQESMVSLEPEKKSLTTVLVENNIKETTKEVEKSKLVGDSKLIVRLKDGREMVCQGVLVNSGIANLQMGGFQLKLPLELLVSVRSSGGSRVSLKSEGNTLGKNQKWSLDGNGNWTSARQDLSYPKVTVTEIGLEKD